MMTTVNKVDDFLEAFPNKVVKHTGRPDYEILNNIKTALKHNFATVPCTLGSGTRGYLGAILTPAEYAAATPVNTPPFAAPPPPPPPSRRCHHHPTKQHRTPNRGHRTTIQQFTSPMDGIQESHRRW